MKQKKGAAALSTRVYSSFLNISNINYKLMVPSPFKIELIKIAFFLVIFLYPENAFYLFHFLPAMVHNRILPDIFPYNISDKGFRS